MRLFRHPMEVTPECRGAAVALGSFDGVHLGHQAVIGRALEYARSYDAAIGVITFEPHPRGFFKPDQKPFRLTPFRTKVRVLQAFNLHFVCCLAFDRTMAERPPEMFAREILRDGLGVAHVVVGEDFCFGKGRSGTATTLKEFGRRFRFGVDAVQAAAGENGIVYSSTAIRECLLAGDPLGVVGLLGRPWEIAGRVEQGDRRGHLLGFPTANLAMGEFLEPRLGVYAIRAALDEGGGPCWFDGVANLGMRPTVGGTRVQLEIHLFDFSGDLYGQHLRVALLGFIRPEMKFSGLEALKAQIGDDCEKARTLCLAYGGPMPGLLGANTDDQ